MLAVASGPLNLLRPLNLRRILPLAQASMLLLVVGLVALALVMMQAVTQEAEEDAGVG